MIVMGIKASRGYIKWITTHIASNVSFRNENCEPKKRPWYRPTHKAGVNGRYFLMKVGFLNPIQLSSQKQSLDGTKTSVKIWRLLLPVKMVYHQYKHIYPLEMKITDRCFLTKLVKLVNFRPDKGLICFAHSLANNKKWKSNQSR